jgi:hypothetical protein
VIKSRRIRWSAYNTGIINIYTSLAGEPEGKRTLGGQRRRWEDTIRIGLKKTE